MLRTRVKKTVSGRYCPQYTNGIRWHFFETSDIRHFEHNTHILINRVSFREFDAAREYVSTIKSNKDVNQILTSPIKQ